MKESEIAAALRGVFISPNVCDSNFENANLVDTTNDIARGLFAVARAIRILAGKEEYVPDK